MSLGPYLLIGLVVVGLITFLRYRRPAPAAARSPVQLPFSVVDIGPFRYFDCRRFSREALLGELHVDAAKRSVAPGPAPNYVWVLPPELGALLLERDDLGKSRLLRPLRDAVPEPAPVFVYVDGWQPDSHHDLIALGAGVRLLLDLPQLVGPGANRDTHEMLDQALPR